VRSSPAAAWILLGKHVGDVLGVSRARVPKSAPRATKDRAGNPKGIEISPQAKGPAHLKRARAY